MQDEPPAEAMSAVSSTISSATAPEIADVQPEQLLQLYVAANPAVTKNTAITLVITHSIVFIVLPQIYLHPS